MNPIENDLPNPEGKPVIILAGKYAGKEGICLGPVSEPQTFAVSPNCANEVVNLKFDREFGILLKGPRNPRAN